MQAMVCLACLLGLTFGNFVSPGIGKCLDIYAALKPDGTRETFEDMQKKNEAINVQLYKCHAKHNQDWEVIDGTIKSASLGWCLQATNISSGANVELDKCNGGDNQKWDLTSKGYVKIGGGRGVCLDIFADVINGTNGTRENWTQIKSRKTVNVQIYKCPAPNRTTPKVNQLWEWAPVSGDYIVNSSIQMWEFRDIGFLHSSNPGHGSLAFAVAGVASLVAAGFFMGFRTRRSSSPVYSDQIMVSQE